MKMSQSTLERPSTGDQSSNHQFDFGDPHTWQLPVEPVREGGYNWDQHFPNEKSVETPNPFETPADTSVATRLREAGVEPVRAKGIARLGKKLRDVFVRPPQSSVGSLERTLQDTHRMSDYRTGFEELNRPAVLDVDAVTVTSALQSEAFAEDERRTAQVALDKARQDAQDATAKIEQLQHEKSNTDMSLWGGIDQKVADVELAHTNAQARIKTSEAALGAHSKALYDAEAATLAAANVVGLKQSNR